MVREIDEIVERYRRVIDELYRALLGMRDVKIVVGGRISLAWLSWSLLLRFHHDCAVDRAVRPDSVMIVCGNDNHTLTLEWSFCPLTGTTTISVKASEDDGFEREVRVGRVINGSVLRPLDLSRVKIGNVYDNAYWVYTTWLGTSERLRIVVPRSGNGVIRELMNQRTVMNVRPEFLAAVSLGIDRGLIDSADAVIEFIKSLT